MFTFLYVKVNYTEICEEVYFPSFSRKMVIFFFRLKANLEKMHGYLKFSLWFPIALGKDLRFPRGPNLAQENFVFSRHRPKAK